MIAKIAFQIETNLFRDAYAGWRIVQVDNNDSTPALVAVDQDDVVIAATRAARWRFGLAMACRLLLMPPSVRPTRQPLWSPVPPVFDRRVVAVQCAFRQVASIISVFGRPVSAASPSIIRAKASLSLHRFQRW
jgi:nucleotidyltransferase/DNA polymerase involved in DNA repair